MGPTPFYGARAENPPPQKKADFAMKQTNICRLSGDINYSQYVLTFDSSEKLSRHRENA